MLKVRVIRCAFFCTAALLACAPAQELSTKAQPAPPEHDPTTPPITEQDLRSRLYIIAHDSMGGRPTGSPGHIKTSDYIAGELKRLGLRPAGDNGTYFQNVPFVRRVVHARELSVAGTALSFGADFAAVLAGATHRPFTNADVVYGGFSEDTATWPTREQAAGKFVVFRQRSMQNGIGVAITHPRLADAAGVGMTGYGGFFRQLADYLGGSDDPVYKSPTAPSGNRPAYIFLSDEAGSKLLGSAPDAAKPGPTGRKASGRLEYGEEPVTARNVVAVWPGQSPALRGQYVAVSAHLDHDPLARQPVDHDSLRLFNAALRRLTVQNGREPSAQERAAIRVNRDSLRALRPARPDSILNGADDDGSGTVALLEIAEAMSAGLSKPQRSVLFVWHVAEELGLIGAQHFTEHPTVPRDSIVAALNLDMIGRGGPGEEPAGGPTYLQLIGWRRLSNELGDIIEKVNAERSQPFTFDLTYDAPGHPEQYYCRSDHAMYARFGIPVAFFSTGNHGDYHEVTDEPQYIDYAKLLNVTRLVNDITVRVAGLENRVKLDHAKPDPREPCRQ